MKVLLVIPEYPPDFGGGISTYYRDLVPALRSRDCDVSILKGSTLDHSGACYAHDGVGVEGLKPEGYAKWLERLAHFAMFPELRRHLAAAFALHEQAKEGDGFDVVEVTDWGMLFMPWVISARAPVLVQLHGSNGQISLHEPVAGREAEGIVSLLLEKTGLAESPGLASYSRGNARWWEQVANRPVAYQPPPFRLEGTLGNLGGAGDRWLAVGRIQQWKGPQVACGAWAALGEEAPGLDWVGRDAFHGSSGEPASRWLRRTFRETWGRTVLPIGQVSPGEVTNRMRAAKAVVVPSTWDVFNLGAAEAMALGKVVVVSSCAGVVDLLQHGVNGFIFQNGDAVALAELVRQIEGMDTSELQAIGRAAVCTIRERLNPDRIAIERITLYLELSARRGMANGLWLRDWLLPPTTRAPLDFLDALPFNDLSRYMGGRTARKILGKGRGA